MRTRPYQSTDADDVAAMLNGIDLAVGRPAVLTGSLADDFVGGMVAAPATDSRVVLANTDVVAAGVGGHPPPPGWPGGVSRRGVSAAARHAHGRDRGWR